MHTPLSPAEVELGFYGKLPAHPDFVSRRLPRSFREPWDAWLQGAIASSRATLDDEWLEYYLTCPVWRFAVAPGICGDAGWAGVVMASVDQVGRYFPLTLAAPLAADASLLTLPSANAMWFDMCEAVVLTALGDEPRSVSDLDEEVTSLPPLVASRQPSTRIAGDAQQSYALSFTPLDDLPRAQTAIMQAMAQSGLGNYSLWWMREQKEDGEGGLALCPGLPGERMFMWLLCGDTPVNARGDAEHTSGDVGDAPPGSAEAESAR